MKKTIYIILADTALVFAACSATDEPIQVLDTPVAAVVVGGIGDGRTRVANTSWESDDQIGISTTSNGKTKYANMQYITSGGDGNFTHVGGAVSGIFFQDTENVTFSAYYPFSTEGTSTGTINDISTEEQTRQKQFDYLFAQSATNRSRPTVNLSFTHKMTRIVLNISADSSSGLTSDHVLQGSYTLSGIKLTGNFNTIDGNATATGDATNDWFLNATPTNQGDVRSYSLIVFPQTISTLTFGANINGKSYAGVFKNLSLSAGTSYTFNISIRKTDLVISSATITDRTEGESDNITTTVDPFNGKEAVLMREGTAYQPPLYVATCNIGAKTPEEAGLYFWWGDVVGHTSGFKFAEGNPEIVTHNKTIDNLKANGYIDDHNNLVPGMDAARQHWGGSWHMPTSEDMEWLLKNCDWDWQGNDPAGYLVTSKSTGGKIFLPAAGMYRDEKPENHGTGGFYWLSTVQNGVTTAQNDVTTALGSYLHLFFRQALPGVPYLGMSVRPVSNYHPGDEFKKEEHQTIFQPPIVRVALSKFTPIFTTRLPSAR